MFWYALLASMVYLLLPRDALAWGPGAHMSYALHALAHASVLALPVRALLKKHAETFLYGTIAADIILGKKYAGELYHCHHWDVAFELLERARQDRERAFIYGYLGHLAVDTVAHNFFVPFKIIRSYETFTLRHTYWEMRFDLKIEGRVWKVLEEVAGQSYVDLDELLERGLKRSLFSFKTSKKIFDSLLLVQRMKKWRDAAALLARRSRYLLKDSDVRVYRRLCHEVLIEFLQKYETARVLRADPAGQLKLLYAGEMASELRAQTRKGLLSKAQAQRLIAVIKDRLREGLYKPSELPALSEVLR